MTGWSRLLALGIPAAIVGAVIVWWLASPLFINRTVHEEFPLSGKATVPETMTRVELEREMEEAAAVETKMAEDMPVGEPVALLRGAFKDADSFHKGSGTATLYRVAGEQIVLRLDPFQVLNGPDLHVYLTSHPAPTNRAEVHSGDYLDLGKLKGNVGSQNYDLPTGTNIEQFHAVVIYCQPFHVVFSVATLASV